MSRLPDPRELALLKKLTRARELAALAELAVIGQKKKSAEDYVTELRSQSHEAASFDEVEIVEKWRAWQSKELQRRLSKLATVTAEYKVVAERCGRFVAENAVMDEVTQRSRAEQKRIRGRRSLGSHIS